MKTTISSLLLMASVNVFGMDKPFMTKEMLDNDIETHEYQFFYTKTLDVELTGLVPKIAYEGKIGGYYDFLTQEQGTTGISMATIASGFNGALEGAKQAVESSIKSGNLFKGAVEGMGIGLVVNPLAKMAFGDDQYAQVIDYYKGNKHITRVVKFIISDEPLPEEERNMIYQVSNDRSYHFNRGKAFSRFVAQDYEKFKKNLNKEQQ